jgi:hypothetical protein
LAVHKNDILRHPIQYYKDLIKELEFTNPEVGHYFERSWIAIFKPEYADILKPV